jgi:hypothetical protein
MRIISKFRDYYDHISNVYGIDPKVVYERPALIKLEEPDYRDIQIEMNGNFPLSTHSDFHSRTRTELLSICGKPHLMKIKQAEFGSGLPDEVRVLTTDESIRFVRSKYFLRELDMRFFDGGTHPMLVELSRILKQPIFRVSSIQVNYGNRKTQFRISNKMPVLSELGVSKIIDQNSLYQEISYFMGNVIYPSPDMDPPVKISDTDRLVQHGFDKRVSFRHRK